MQKTNSRVIVEDLAWYMLILANTKDLLHGSSENFVGVISMYLFSLCSVTNPCSFGSVFNVKKEGDRQKREIREKRQLWKASRVWVWVKHRPTRVLPRNPFCPLIHPLRGWIHPLLIALQLIVTMPLNQGFSYDKSILFRWLGYNRQVVGAQYGSTSRSVSIKQYGRRVNQTDVPQRLHYVNKYNIWDLHVRCWYRW